MHEHLLIAHSSPKAAVFLKKQLSGEGYKIAIADSIVKVRQLLHRHPDLILLDTDLAQQADADQLESLGAELELAEIFCLRLCPANSDDAALRVLVPFANGSLTPPHSKEQVLELVQTVLRIKQAEQLRNLAQERLVMQRTEVAEGLRSAALIQHALLPERTPELPSFSCAWQFQPCDAVGGDQFNLLQLSEEMLMAYMLDVSGHGVSSAMVAVSVYQSLSDRTGRLVKQPLKEPPYFRINEPRDVLAGLDREFPFERFEKFFTIAYLLLEPGSGRVSYCNGGHPPPLLLRASGGLERLETGGPLVGMGGLVPYEQATVQLSAGDRLYLYSDGITELTNPAGEMFGEKRLSQFFRRRQQLPLTQSAELFMADLEQFSEGLKPADDISLLCIQYHG